MGSSVDGDRVPPYVAFRVYEDTCGKQLIDPVQLLADIDHDLRELGGLLAATGFPVTAPLPIVPPLPPVGRVR